MAAQAQQLEPAGVLTGLTDAQVSERLNAGLVNHVNQQTTRSYWTIVRQNALNVVNILLFGISAGLIALGLYGDAVVTAGLVIINIGIGIFQEIRAKRQLDGIALLNRPRALVLRAGRQDEIDPSDVVLGDFVVLKAGDQVLVDGLVVSEGEAGIDESNLTGESDLVRKHRGDTLHSGSVCMTGAATYEATEVGEDTVAQKMTAQARTYRNVRTPLQREVDLILRVMGVFVLLIALQTVRSFNDLYESIPLVESMRAAAVLVALIPQGLVLMIAVTYSLAVMRLANSGVLIQRLNAVESTSHIDVLCVDKTGTLTTQALEVEAVYPVGIEESELRRVIGEFAASVSSSNKTNDALRTAFASPANPVTDEIAFDSARKWSALSPANAEHGPLVLGAPEILASHVGNYGDVEPEVKTWADQGLRVLLLACSPGAAGLRGPDGEPVLPGGMQALGVISIRDQLRPGAKETIQSFAEIGVQVKVISGDNPDTVLALARQCGIPESATAIAGHELNGLSDEQLEEVAEANTVFGRVTPEHKESLVAALTRRGHYVAMTGDGVNDILALKQAKVAIAMRSGSEATRGVADIVLMDDSFSVLPETFSEGQRIMRGMYDVIKLFLTRTLFVAFLVLGATLIEIDFPITPKQNSLLATLTVGIPAFALVIWAVPGRTPRRLLPTIVEFVIPAALVVALISLAVYQFFLTMSDNTIWAQAAVSTTMVACGLLIVLFAQPPSPAWVGGSSLNGDLRPAAMVIGLFALYVLVLAVPGLRHFFELTTLPFSGYIMIGFVVAGWAIIVRTLWRWALGRRLTRMWRRRYQRAPAAPEQSVFTGS